MLFVSIHMQGARIIGNPVVAYTLYISTVITAVIVFAVLGWYFNSQTTTSIVISPTPLSDRDCSTLNAKHGLTFLNSINSENAQYAQASESFGSCTSQLKTIDICTVGINPYIVISSPTQYLGANGGCTIIMPDGSLHCSTFDLSVIKSAYTQVSHGASTSLQRPVAPNSTITTTSSKSIPIYMYLNILS